jgi:hypothetical protein
MQTLGLLLMEEYAFGVGGDWGRGVERSPWICCAKYLVVFCSKISEF